MKMRFNKTAVLIAAVLLSAQSIAFAQSPSPQAVSLYNLGLTAYRQGSPESAIIFFKRATDIDPSLADAQYNLGIIYQTQRRYKEAIPRFEEVLKIKPSDPDAHYQLGQILQELGQLPEAKQHLANIPPNNSHFADAQNRIAAINNQPNSGQIAGGNPGSNIAPTQTVNTYPSTPAYNQNTPVYSFANQSSPSVPANQPIAANNQITSSGQYINPNNVAVDPSASVNSVNTIQQSQTPVVTQSPVAPPPAPNLVPTLANTTLRVIATGFSAPSGLAFDRIGNLYVANYLNNTIDRISTDGSKSRFSSGANIKGPIGLAVDTTGYVYVANYNSGSVARISPAGVTTLVATGFRKPYYLALDHEGNLYVSQQEDNSVVRISLPRAVSAKLP